MEKKEMYTMRELYEELEIPIAELGRRAKISDVTLAKIRDGHSARRSTINSLLRIFSEIYGVKLSLDNVSGVIIRDKIARQDQVIAVPTTTIAEKPVTLSDNTSIINDTIGANVSQKRTTPRKYESKETEIPSDLPEGTVKLIDFIEKHELPESSMSRWTNREKGIKKGEWIETTARAKASGMGTQHFLTPAQQERALEILRKHGKLKEKPIEEERPWYAPDGE